MPSGASTSSAASSAAFCAFLSFLRITVGTAGAIPSSGRLPSHASSASSAAPAAFAILRSPSSSSACPSSQELRRAAAPPPPAAAPPGRRGAMGVPRAPARAGRHAASCCAESRRRAPAPGAAAARAAGGGGEGGGAAAATTQLHVLHTASPRPSLLRPLRRRRRELGGRDLQLRPQRGILGRNSSPRVGQHLGGVSADVGAARLFQRGAAVEVRRLQHRFDILRVELADVRRERPMYSPATERRARASASTIFGDDAV